MYMDSSIPAEKRLGLSDTFRFSCHSGLACFNSCCHNKHLPLTPFDALRLKEALGIHSDDLLTRYTVYTLDPHTGFPVISLAMGEAPQRPCPFIGPNGCTVYAHRPTACRVFPLARVCGPAREGAERDQFYYMLDLPACRGFGEEKTWTVREWGESQGLAPYIAMNDPVADLVLGVRRARRTSLDESALRKVLVACYNLDIFREFVTKTNFFDFFEVDAETRSAVETSDEALLKLGLAYLRKALIPLP